MREQVSIIMPAFRAEQTIATSVRSVILSTLADWELLIASDDGQDYEQLLSEAGIADERIRFTSTKQTCAGSSAARNVALTAARGRYAALLDADDAFVPDKLDRVVSAMRAGHGLVSTGLSVRRDGRELRQVGADGDLMLTPLTYKFTNLSMDAMLAWDRSIADPRADEGLDCLTDLDLLLKLFESHDHAAHLGAPLHVYTKQALSISNGPEAGARYRRRKSELITDLTARTDAGRWDGFVRFLSLSLEAEKSFEAALARDPDLIFEDHLGPLLRA